MLRIPPSLFLTFSLFFPFFSCSSQTMRLPPSSTQRSTQFFNFSRQTSYQSFSSQTSTTKLYLVSKREWRWSLANFCSLLFPSFSPSLLLSLPAKATKLEEATQHEDFFTCARCFQKIQDNEGSVPLNGISPLFFS